MRVPGRSRRNFLKVSAGAGGAAMVGGLLPVRITSLPVAFSQPVTVYSSDDNVTMRFPGNEEVLKSSLTVRLEWEYALKEKAWVRGRLLPYWNYLSVNLKVSPNEDIGIRWWMFTCQTILRAGAWRCCRSTGTTGKSYPGTRMVTD